MVCDRQKVAVGCMGVGESVGAMVKWGMGINMEAGASGSRRFSTAGRAAGGISLVESNYEWIRLPPGVSIRSPVSSSIVTSPVLATVCRSKLLVPLQRGMGREAKENAGQWRAE